MRGNNSPRLPDKGKRTSDRKRLAAVAELAPDLADDARHRLGGRRGRRLHLYPESRRPLHTRAPDGVQTRAYRRSHGVGSQPDAPRGSRRRAVPGGPAAEKVPLVLQSLSGFPRWCGSTGRKIKARR